MSTARIVSKTEKDKATDAPPTEERTSFEWTLADGATIVVGKPRGVLKLKLRDLLTPDLIKDPEISAIASALLSIQSVNGQPIILRTFSEFQFLLDRFGSDAQLEEFMAEYQRLVNPGFANIVQSALDEAIEKKLKPDQIQELIALRVMEFEAKSRDKVKF